MGPNSSSRSGTRTRAAGFTLVALALIGALLYAIFGGPHLSDEEQIYAIVQQIQVGVAQQSVPITTQALSRKFQVNGITRQQVRMEIGQFYRQHATSSILFQQPDLQLHGDTATVTVYVELDGSPQNGGPSKPLYKGLVTVNLAKEPARRLLFIPTSVWRITSAQAPGAESIEGF